MATAITPLANITLGSATNSVTFSSISSAYRDLFFVITPLAPTTGGSICFRFNGDSGTNYNDVQMYGTGSATGSDSRANNSLGYFGADSAVQSVTTAHVFDYTATDKHKSWLGRGNPSNNLVAARAGRWANTAAITSVEIRNDSQNFSIGATFALYGVSA